MSTTMGYDRIAFVYDLIAKIFSFDQINKSQLGFLAHVSIQQRCLILGGGTGYFLEKLLETNNAVHVTYVDASAKMIAKAQQRIRKNDPSALERVTFICNRVEDFEFGGYDVIVCNYFLDLFDDAYVSLLIERFKQHLNEAGLLYITDFSIPEKGFMRWSSKAGVRMLYKLFEWTTNLQTQNLPAIDTIVKEKGFCVLHTKYFFKRILKCTTYIGQLKA